MRISARMDPVRPISDGAVARLSAATTGAMNQAVQGLTEELKAQIYGAGLGLRVSNTWRGTTYPKSRNSLDPAGYVWSKAPNIVSFFSSDNVVRAANGTFLAIPTENTPLGRGGRRMTVADVEARYGRQLVFIQPGDRGFRTPSIRRAGVAFLVLKGLVVRKSNQSWRNPSARELARGRQTSDIIMFILVPQVRGQKRLDYAGAAERWAQQVPALITERLAGGA